MEPRMKRLTSSLITVKKIYTEIVDIFKKFFFLKVNGLLHVLEKLAFPFGIKV